MRFVWDENKNRSNLAKHGISFEAASQAFDDPYAITVRDRVVEGEERWHTLGAVARRIILVVVHTYRDREGEEFIRIISARKAIPVKEPPMRKVSKKIRRELDALAKVPDDQIDLSDIPEITDWSGAIRGMFYRPIKKSLTLRLDADVLAWLRSQGPGYQTRINQLLRATMISQLRRRKKAS